MCMLLHVRQRSALNARIINLRKKVLLFKSQELQESLDSIGPNLYAATMDVYILLENPTWLHNFHIVILCHQQAWHLQSLSWFAVFCMLLAVGKIVAFGPGSLVWCADSPAPIAARYHRTSLQVGRRRIVCSICVTYLRRMNCTLQLGETGDRTYFMFRSSSKTSGYHRNHHGNL